MLKNIIIVQFFLCFLAKGAEILPNFAAENR